MPSLQINFEISNGRIIFSKGEGLRVSTIKEAIIENVIFENNMDYGINVIFSKLVTLKNLSFFNHKNSYVMRINQYLPILENINADSSNRKRGIFFDNVEVHGGAPRTLGDRVPYVIKAGSTFYVYDTLKVLKGVIFKFDSLASLNIRAPFIVEGTENDTVYFTSLKDDEIGGDTNGDSTNTLPSPGDWQCIYFYSDTLQSRMSYFKVRYGGGGYYGANIYNFLASAIFENGSVEKSLNYGIRLDLYSTTASPRSVLIRNVSFTQNTSYGIYAGNTWEHNLKIRNLNFKKHKNTYLMKFIGKLPDIDSVFADTTNKKIGIEIYNGLVSSGRPKALKCKIPFVIKNSILNYDTLKIFPGVIMKFDSAAYFSVRSPLIAEGTISDSIYFTSLKDDEIGGDTNGDSANTFPSPGDWKGIEFSGSGKSILKFFKIKYGIDNIYIGWGADSTKFVYGTVEKAKEHGYVFSRPIEIYFNKIRENKIGIEAGGAYGKLKVNFSEIYNNTQCGVKNTFSSYTIDAKYNFWGDSTGPYHPTLNPNGQGNPVSDHVDFIPWLKFPPQYFYGKITKDTVWENIILLVGDVLIDTFATLQIKPGTKIFVLDKDLENIRNDPERIEVIVFGKIFSIGTANDTIIFDQLNGEEGKWVGIIIKNEGSFFTYTKIKKASTGISIQNTKDVSIKNSKIIKNVVGLNITNSQNVTLKSLNISENLRGINILNSQCAIESSFIYKNYGKTKNLIVSKEDTFFTDTLTGIYISNGDLILKNNKIHR